MQAGVGSRLGDGLGRQTRRETDRSQQSGEDNHRTERANLRLQLRIVPNVGNQGGSCTDPVRHHPSCKLRRSPSTLERHNATRLPPLLSRARPCRAEAIILSGPDHGSPPSDHPFAAELSELPA